MDARTRRLHEVVKTYDRRLSAYRNKAGTTLILRKADKLDASDFDQEDAGSCIHPQLILSLTDNWKADGKPVDWGIEPVMDRIRSMDLWRDTDKVKRMRERRERADEDQKRAQANENRAMALDMRKDFAKAFNEINTSTLEKVDPRRNKNGSH